MASHFKKFQSFGTDYSDAFITQYESERTGMRVTVCDRQGPKVAGYFTLATEIHDDSGAPHTLEHLIFMGSKSYQYKGLLDKLATRMYSFTNAWTATDHTAYTLDTAGWAGFAKILPVYLEHVLLPTLHDAACYTEVWHIDGEGNDAGVVYSEMQGVQNNQSELMELAARRILYPKGNGFRYETGGMMEALRVLSADRIRRFHKDMYQPKNLRLVLFGEVDHSELIEILEKFEDTILEDVPAIDAPFQRPWVESKPTPPLQEDVVKTVEFPEEDESTGEILIGFFGPGFRNTLETAAMDILLTYLSGSSVSLLENTLVEKEQICSSVYAYQESRPNSVIWFTLTAVETKQLATVEQRFFDVLKEANSKPIDAAYMLDCIKRFRRSVVYAAEASYTFFRETLIEDHLFGTRDGKELEDSLSKLWVFDKLEQWTDDQWRSFISKYIIDNKHVSILGVPSLTLSDKLKAEETARVKAQQERLGEQGLAKLAKQLEEAKAHNDRPIPKEILEKFTVPSPDSIHFIPSITARSGKAKGMGKLDNEIQKIVDKDESGLPLFIHFEHVATNFVHFSVFMNTSPVALELKPLLHVWATNFFSTPIMRDGKRIEYEQVMKELEQDTISFSVESASYLGCSELLRIKFSVEREKYETAVKWVRDLCLNSIFDAERLKPTIAKLIADIPDEKRDGNDMSRTVHTMIHYAPTSGVRAQGTLVKALYLKRISRLLSTNPEEVISKLESIRKSLITFDNIHVFVTADLHKVTSPVKPWAPLVTQLDKPDQLLPLDTRRAVLSDAAKKPGGLSYIVPMPTIDSSFGLLSAKCIESYQHPRLPAIIVAISYLDAVEGPLWVAVRGTGLAYGTNFYRSIDTGMLDFSIYRSPDAFKAYQTSRDVIAALASGDTELDDLAMEGAVSSIVVSFADEQPGMINAAAVGFVNQVIKGIPKDWAKDVLKEVRKVTKEDVRNAMRDYILPIFDPKTANMVITCATIMQEGLVKNFEEAGFKPEVRTLASFQEDYGLKGPEGEEDGEEEEEDDEEGDEGEDEDGEEDEED